MKEGWIPEFNNDGSNINIGVPRALGIPAIIGYLLFKAAGFVFETEGQYYEKEALKYESRMKKLEYYEMLENVPSSKKINLSRRSAAIVRTFESKSQWIEMRIGDNIRFVHTENDNLKYESSSLSLTKGQLIERPITVFLPKPNSKDNPT